MKALLLLAILTTLVSCATKKTKQVVAEKVAQESTTTPKSLGHTIHDLIESSKTLTDAQKTELRSIISKNKETADSLNAESFKYRSVLIKELLSGSKINKKEVYVIKKNIKRIEQAKLKNTFDTVEKITAIVSGTADKDQFADQLLKIDLLPR